jgi:hypothetical protein
MVGRGSGVRQMAPGGGGKAAQAEGSRLVLGEPRVGVQLVTVKNFVCQLQFPSDKGTSGEKGWSRGFGGEARLERVHGRGYHLGTSRSGRSWAMQERTGVLEASRPAKGSAKAPWPRRGTGVTTNSRRRYKARNARKGKCNLASLGGNESEDDAERA